VQHHDAKQYERKNWCCVDRLRLRCCAGPDMTMLRRVEILTDDDNYEIVFIHAGSNREAMEKLWAGRTDIKSMLATPMPN